MKLHFYKNYEWNELKRQSFISLVKGRFLDVFISW